MRAAKNKSGYRGIAKHNQGWRIKYIHQRPTGDASIRSKYFRHLDDAVRFYKDNEGIVL